jgi:hypothetical protein
MAGEMMMIGWRQAQAVAMPQHEMMREEGGFGFWGEQQ